MVEQVVDRRVGDADRGGHGSGHAVAFGGVRRWIAVEATSRGCHLINDTSSSAARRTSSLTIGHVELLRGGQLDPCGGQPAARSSLVLGAAADQPAHQLLPAGRREEDEQRLRHRVRAPGARPAGRSRAAPAARRASALLDRAPRGAVRWPAVHDGPLQQLAGLDHPVELGVGRRSGSGRRRPRPGAGAGWSTETDSQTSGWCCRT